MIENFSKELDASVFLDELKNLDSVSGFLFVVTVEVDFLHVVLKEFLFVPILGEVDELEPG